MESLRRLLAAIAIAAFTTGAASAHDVGSGHSGALYTMSNAADGNSVIEFERTADGSLAPAGTYPTGGTGTGAGLGNQGGLILDEDAGFLFVVNAGSDEITVFAVRRLGLRFVQTVPSRGDRPISLTLDDDILYVLNAGSDSIAGFRVSHRGSLTPLSGSIRPLSGTGTDPAQIQFSPDGRTLVVTEKATNSLLTYQVGDDGRPATEPRVFPSAGATPFGFAFDKRRELFVSEAAGGAAGASSLSSYLVGREGRLRLVSPSVATEQTAACWVVVTPNHRFAYVSNTGSGNISGFHTGPGGALERFDDGGVTGVTGAGSAPIDMAISPSGSFLYSLNSGNQTISAFRIRHDGALRPLQVVSGLPAGGSGLAVR
jgi:6-phosphogluconolactonase (cycloisomerase 2 family)